MTSFQQTNPKYTKKTVNHCGGSFIDFGCFTACGVGPIVKIEGIISVEMYRDMLRNNLSDNLTLAWIFQQDNGLKHCCKMVKSRLSEEGINILQRPPQTVPSTVRMSKRCSTVFKQKYKDCWGKFNFLNNFNAGGLSI